MLKKTIEATENEELLRATVTTTYLLFGRIIYQRTIDRALLLTFPTAKF